MDPLYYEREDYNNMSLVEDRILSFDIFATKNNFLKYLPDSICNTDAPTDLIGLLR